MEPRDPATHSSFVNRGGRGEMRKAPMSLQDLRRRIYVKVKAEQSWRSYCAGASAGSGGVVDGYTTHSGCSTTTGSDTSGHRRKPLRPISPITLGEKCVGARSAGNPHAACEEAGTGDGATDILTRARRGKPRIQPREVLRVTAPVLDPTRAWERKSGSPPTSEISSNISGIQSVE